DGQRAHVRHEFAVVREPRRAAEGASVSELRGRLLIGGRMVPGVVRFAQGRITSIDIDSAPSHAAELPILAPGFVDLHVHGFGGHDPLDALPQMAAALARVGTTAFQPTLFPDAPTRLGETAERVWVSAQRCNKARDGVPTAHIVGLHLEGPFVNPVRAGALPRESL